MTNPAPLLALITGAPVTANDLAGHRAAVQAIRTLLLEMGRYSAGVSIKDQLDLTILPQLADRERRLQRLDARLNEIEALATLLAPVTVAVVDVMPAMVDAAVAMHVEPTTVAVVDITPAMVDAVAVAHAAPAGGVTRLQITSAGVSGSTSLILTLPVDPATGLRAVGDLMVLDVSINTANTISTPAGWTQIFTSLLTAENRISSFRKIVDGSEASPLTVSTVNANKIGICKLYRGHDPTTPIGAVDVHQGIGAVATLSDTVVAAGDLGHMMVFGENINDWAQPAAVTGGPWGLVRDQAASTGGRLRNYGAVATVAGGTVDLGSAVAWQTAAFTILAA